MGSGQGRCVARYGVFDPGLGQNACINDVVLASCVEAKLTGIRRSGRSRFCEDAPPELVHGSAWRVPFE